MTAPYGFWVLESPHGPRHLVEHARLASAYAGADPAVDPATTAYLSAWSYPEDLLRHREAHLARAAGAKAPEAGWTAGYRGPAAAPWLHFDLDRADPATALEDAARLVAYLADRYGPDGLSVYYSGSKGCHVDLWTGGLIAPSPGVPKVARRLAETIAAESGGIAIDPAIYSPVALFRATNSKHGRTGLYKTPIPLADLAAGIPIAEVRRRAAEPIPHSLPTSAPGPRFLEDWTAAETAHRAALEALAAPRTPTEADTRINPLTWSLILHPETTPLGDRHRTVFSAAADLMEKFSEAEDLIVALLTPRGLLTGLPPSEVARQIKTGIEHAGGGA